MKHHKYCESCNKLIYNGTAYKINGVYFCQMCYQDGCHNSQQNVKRLFKIKDREKLLFRFIAIVLSLCLSIMAGYRVGVWYMQYNYPMPGMDRVAAPEEVNIVFLMIFLSVFLLILSHRKK